MPVRGWPNVNGIPTCPLGFLLLLMLFNVTAVAAQEETPPLALLEYLGEWLDEGGNEIDPQELALLQLDGEPVGGESDDKE